MLACPPVWYVGSLGAAVPAVTVGLAGWGLLSAVTHPATALCLPGRTRLYGLVASVVLVLTTAYTSAGDPSGSGRGIAAVVGAVGGLWVLALFGRSREVVCAAAMGALLMVAVGDAQIRYLMPAAFLGALR